MSFASKDLLDDGEVRDHFFQQYLAALEACVVQTHDSDELPARKRARAHEFTPLTRPFEEISQELCATDPKLWITPLGRFMVSLSMSRIPGLTNSPGAHTVYHTFAMCASHIPQEQLYSYLRVWFTYPEDQGACVQLARALATTLSPDVMLWSSVILDQWASQWHSNRASPNRWAPPPVWEQLLLHGLLSGLPDRVHLPWVRNYLAGHGSYMFLLYLCTSEGEVHDILYNDKQMKGAMMPFPLTSLICDSVLTLTTAGHTTDAPLDVWCSLAHDDLPMALISILRAPDSIFPAPDSAQTPREIILVWISLLMECRWTSIATQIPQVFGLLMQVASTDKAPQWKRMLASDIGSVVAALLNKECTTLMQAPESFSDGTPSVSTEYQSGNLGLLACLSSISYLCQRACREEDPVFSVLYCEVLIAIGLSQGSNSAGQIILQFMLHGVYQVHIETFWRMYSSFSQLYGSAPFEQAVMQWGKTVLSLEPEMRRSSVSFVETLSESLCLCDQDETSYDQPAVDALFHAWTVLLVRLTHDGHGTPMTLNSQATTRQPPSSVDIPEDAQLVQSIMLHADSCIPFASESHPSLPEFVDWTVTFMWSQLDSSLSGRTDHAGVAASFGYSAQQHSHHLELGKQVLVTITKSHLSLRPQIVDTLMDLVFTSAAADYILREPAAVLPSTALDSPLQSYLHPHRTAATFEDSKVAQQNDRLFNDQHLRSRFGPVTHQDTRTHKQLIVSHIIASNIGHLRDLFQRLVYPSSYADNGMASEIRDHLLARVIARTESKPNKEMYVHVLPKRTNYAREAFFASILEKNPVLWAILDVLSSVPTQFAPCHDVLQMQLAHTISSWHTASPLVAATNLPMYRDTCALLHIYSQAQWLPEHLASSVHFIDSWRGPAITSLLMVIFNFVSSYPPFMSDYVLDIGSISTSSAVSALAEGTLLNNSYEPDGAPGRTVTTSGRRRASSVLVGGKWRRKFPEGCVTDYSSQILALVRVNAETMEPYSAQFWQSLAPNV